MLENPNRYVQKSKPVWILIQTASDFGGQNKGSIALFRQPKTTLLGREK
jgi:hypothetical protein